MSCGREAARPATWPTATLHCFQIRRLRHSGELLVIALCFRHIRNNDDTYILLYVCTQLCLGTGWSPISLSSVTALVAAPVPVRGLGANGGASGRLAPVGTWSGSSWRRTWLAWAEATASSLPSAVRHQQTTREKSGLTSPTQAFALCKPNLRRARPSLFLFSPPAPRVDTLLRSLHHRYLPSRLWVLADHRPGPITLHQPPRISGAAPAPQARFAPVCLAFFGLVQAHSRSNRHVIRAPLSQLGR